MGCNGSHDSASSAQEPRSSTGRRLSQAVKMDDGEIQREISMHLVLSKISAEDLTADRTEKPRNSQLSAEDAGAFADVVYMVCEHKAIAEADWAPSTSTFSTHALKDAIRIQMLAGNAWVDLPDEEAADIRDHMLSGELSFDILPLCGSNAYRVQITGTKMTRVDLASGETVPVRIMRVSDLEGSVSASDSWKHAGSTDSKHSQQRQLGAQSLRGNPGKSCMRFLVTDSDKKAFDMLFDNEQRHCGEFVAFYHSYSFAALLYEVQAAVASVLFGFHSDLSCLPRLLVTQFDSYGSADDLVKRFNAEWIHGHKDHTLEYRRVCISVMCSALSTGPECCLPRAFSVGYSCKGISYRANLEHLLVACGVPEADVMDLADKIVSLSTTFGLDTSQFGGAEPASGRPGHILQIFVRRSLVDRFCYPALPYGVPDSGRMPFAQWMDGTGSFSVGQARILAHPLVFMNYSAVRMYTVSSDPGFQEKRLEFQRQLGSLLSCISGTAEVRQQAAMAICGGCLPSWWAQ